MPKYIIMSAAGNCSRGKIELLKEGSVTSGTIMEVRQQVIDFGES